MFYVLLKKPLPGIRATVFFFEDEEEAYEFSSLLHKNFGPGGPLGPNSSGAKHDGVETENGRAGEATEVFPEWSF